MNWSNISHDKLQRNFDVVSIRLYWQFLWISNDLIDYWQMKRWFNQNYILYQRCMVTICIYMPKTWSDRFWGDVQRLQTMNTKPWKKLSFLRGTTELNWLSSLNCNYIDEAKSWPLWSGYWWCLIFLILLKNKISVNLLKSLIKKC